MVSPALAVGSQTERTQSEEQEDNRDNKADHIQTSYRIVGKH